MNAFAAEIESKTSNQTTSQALQDSKQAIDKLQTVKGLVMTVKQRTSARLRINDNNHQALVGLILFKVSSEIEKQCNRKYYFNKIYPKSGTEVRKKHQEFGLLSKTWIELKNIKIVNQGTKHAACLFGELKVIDNQKKQ